MSHQIIKEAQQAMDKAIQNLKNTLATVRAGRANAGVLEQVFVDYYGVPTPVNQVASISAPEARMLMISPYDPNSLKDIEKAILKSNIGINPNNDGSVLRLVFPALTEDRRKELAKEVGKYEEEAKIRIRQARRDAIDQATKAEKAKELTEDDLRVMQKDIQDLTDGFVKKIETIAKEKEKDLMTD